MARGKTPPDHYFMGVIEKSRSFSSSDVKTSCLRSRSESVKNVVRSFESLKDIVKPFKVSRESLKDAVTTKILTKNGRTGGSCESLRSVRSAVTPFSRDYDEEDNVHSIKSAPGNIGGSATLQDVFTFTFDVSLSLNTTPMEGSPGRTNFYNFYSILHLIMNILILEIAR